MRFYRIQRAGQPEVSQELTSHILFVTKFQSTATEIFVAQKVLSADLFLPALKAPTP